MTARHARALRALADRLAPTKPVVINTIYLDGREIVRAIKRAANDGGARR